MLSMRAEEGNDCCNVTRRSINVAYARLTPMDRTTLPHAQSTIALYTELIDVECVDVESTWSRRWQVFGCLRRRAR